MDALWPEVEKAGREKHVRTVVDDGYATDLLS